MSLRGKLRKRQNKAVLKKEKKRQKGNGLKEKKGCLSKGGGVKEENQEVGVGSGGKRKPLVTRMKVYISVRKKDSERYETIWKSVWGGRKEGEGIGGRRRGLFVD